MISVDIEQQLGDFRLAVKFSAEAPIVGLFGRSGSGKTSVVNAIAGIGRPQRGSIRVNEEILYDAAERIDLPPNERRVGYVFQDSLLFPHMDVESNLRYGFKARSPTTKRPPISPSQLILFKQPEFQAVIFWEHSSIGQIHL